METLNTTEIGELVKAYRKASNFTQFRLSELVGIDDKQLGKIERGIHYPSVPTFLKLIKILNIDICEFYKNPVQNLHDSNTVITYLKKLSPSEINRAYQILKAVFE